MLHKVKASHGDILRGLPELARRLPPSVHKKRQLLDMARRGEPRPHQKKHPLGAALRRYTAKDSSSHDPRFTREIRALRPDWFTTQSDAANQKKRQLLEMARKGSPRPSQKQTLGKALSRYASPKSESHDPTFHKEIRRLAPHWFASQSEIADRKKERLLRTAREGGARPSGRTKIGKSLCEYTSVKSSTHDPAFAKEIRRIRPDWFVTRSQAAQRKKRTILDMARRGEPRPTHETPLGQALYRYSSPKSDCHDPLFAKKAKRLAPHWFKPCSTR